MNIGANARTAAPRITKMRRNALMTQSSPEIESFGRFVISLILGSRPLQFKLVCPAVFPALLVPVLNP
jgi:hypothetical protein